MSQKELYRAVNTVLVQRNWLIGYRIVEEELGGAHRAEYGADIIKKLSKELTEKYGKGFTNRICIVFILFINHIRRFSRQCLENLRFNFRGLTMDSTARKWYENEAVRETWSVRTLQRNVVFQYYYRILKSQVKEPVREEMQKLTKSYQQDRLEFIKNPMIVEFLGFELDTSFTETKLETSIISNLQKFLMEMGKGYAFVARQQHIHTEKQDYYIDLVFYNYILKCFVLIDLKTSRIKHQDVGQMDI